MTVDYFQVAEECFCLRRDDIFPFPDMMEHFKADPSQCAYEINWHLVPAAELNYITRLQTVPVFDSFSYSSHEGKDALFLYDQAGEVFSLCELSDVKHSATLMETSIEVRFPLGLIIVCARILSRSAVVLHASAIDDHGQGILFIGRSGIGKSTQAGLWSNQKGVTLINEDRVAVRNNAGTVTAYGFPWGGKGKVALNHKMPAKGLFLLEQATANTLHELKGAEAVAGLMSCAWLPFWKEDDLDHAIAVIEDIVAHVPVYRLACRPDDSVIPLVRSALGMDWE